MKTFKLSTLIILLGSLGYTGGDIAPVSHYTIEDAIVAEEEATVAPVQQYIEPTHVVAEPTQQYIEPTHVVAEPTQQYVEPAPVVAEPTQQYVEPTPVVVKPAPQYVEPAPQPVVVQSAPCPEAKPIVIIKRMPCTEPSPIVVAPEPEPIVVAPAPVMVAPEPVVVEPEPVVVEPEPVVVAPAPVVVAPEPVVVAPEPVVVAPAPQPVVVEPTPQPVVVHQPTKPVVVAPKPRKNISTNGFYAGLGITGARYKDSCHCKKGLKVTNKDTTYGGMARVGYDFNQYIGIEARGIKTSLKSDGSKVEHAGIYVKPMLPVGNSTNIYGLIGAGKTKTKGSMPHVDSKSLALGAGIEVDLSRDIPKNGRYSRNFDGHGDQEKGVGLFVDYERMVAKKHAPILDAVSAGVTYDF